MKIRVCHITSVHKQNDVRIFEKECVSLVQYGFDVHLLVCNGKPGRYNEVQVSSVKFNGGRFKRIFLMRRKLLAEALKINASIYHFHDPELIPLGLKLMKRGKKVIYDVHEDVPRQILDKIWIPKWMRGFISRQFEKYENRAIKKINGVIAAAPVIYNRFKGKEKKCIGVYNFPKLEFFSEQTEWQNRTNNLLYIGGIFKTRGIYEMVNAIENLSCKLTLAGEFESESLKSEITQLEGWKNVNFLGFVNRDTIKKELQAAKIGLVVLHPTKSYVEAYPVKMFEYMAAGIPVISSDFPLWSSIISEYDCGISVDPLNISAIKKAITELLADDMKCKRLGENGRKAAFEFFSWEQEAKKLVDFYNTL